MESRERRKAVRALTEAYAEQIRIHDFHDDYPSFLTIEVPNDFLKKYMQTVCPDLEDKLPNPLEFWRYTKLERVVARKAAGTDIQNHVDGVLFEFKNRKNHGCLDAEYLVSDNCPPDSALIQVCVDRRDPMAMAFSKEAEEAVEEIQEQEREERIEEEKAEVKKKKREADGMLPRTPYYMHISGQVSLEQFEKKKK